LDLRDPSSSMGLFELLGFALHSLGTACKFTRISTLTMSNYGAPIYNLGAGNFPCGRPFRFIFLRQDSLLSLRHHLQVADPLDTTFLGPILHLVLPFACCSTTWAQPSHTRSSLASSPHLLPIVDFRPPTDPFSTTLQGRSGKHRISDPLAHTSHSPSRIYLPTRLSYRVTLTSSMRQPWCAAAPRH